MVEWLSAQARSPTPMKARTRRGDYCTSLLAFQLRVMPLANAEITRLRLRGGRIGCNIQRRQMQAARGSQRCSLRPPEQVWLPNLQVWAAMGSQPVQRGLPASSFSGSEPVHAKPSAVCGTASPGRVLQAVTAVETSESMVQAEPNTAADDALPTCPICLTEIQRLEDKAVLSSCMHVFCVICISRWAAKKRVCPLCKGRIQGYMYNIKSEQEYQERIIPASPERPPSPPVRSSLLSRWGPTPLSLIDSHATSLSFAAQAQSQQEFRQHWRNTAQYYFGSSGRQLQGSGRGVSITPSQAARQRQAGSSTTASREPRPYYYRVQQQMQAAAANQSHHSMTSSQAAPVDAATAWRRNIYADGMYALSPGSQAAAVPASVAAAPDRSRRLQEWVDRELQALLDQEDVTIVRSFVMSLATDQGLHRHQTKPQGQHQQQGVCPNESERIAALRPFLHERTAHFWHELKCFAAAPYSMATYDRVVQYQRHVSQVPQVGSAADLSSIPNSDSSQHAVRGASGQELSQAPSWAPPDSANAAAPSSAVPSSLQQPGIGRPEASTTRQQALTVHSRPNAPYLGTLNGMQPSRHRLHPASTAAAAAADKRQLARERRLSLQQGSRPRQVAENATAAEGREQVLAHQSVAPHHEFPAACGTRPHAVFATGVIDLTADSGSASPGTSTSSDCMILGATAAAMQCPLASGSAAHTVDWAQAGPGCVMEVPMQPSSGTHCARSAEAGMAEARQSSDGVVRVPRGEVHVADIGLGSASVRTAARPWQSSNLAVPVPGSHDRPAHLSGVSARPGGSSLGAPWEHSAQPTARSAGAQAASTHGRRSRWDVMPDSMSADVTPAQQPPLSSNTPGSLPSMHNRGFNAAQSVLSLHVPGQAEGQLLHGQHPVDEAREVSADSRLEQGQAATRQESQGACRTTDQQRKKRSSTGRKHCRRSKCRSSSQRSRHSRDRSHSSNSYRSDGRLKHSKHSRHSDHANKLCIAGSRSRHTRHVNT